MQFAKIASPLHHLTIKEFNALIQALALGYLDFEKSFMLETNVCVKRLFAVLSQQQDDGNLHPVAFVSQSLSSPEKNYSITKLEIKLDRHVGDSALPCLCPWA